MVEYIGVGIVIGIVFTIIFYLYKDYSKKKDSSSVNFGPVTATSIIKEMGEPIEEYHINERGIQIEKLSIEAICDETKLIEIKDSQILARINHLVPELAQVGNTVNNAIQAGKANGQVLYRVIIPAGAKLANSNAMNGAVRGIYHNADGIKGHADLLPVGAQQETAVVANTVATAMNVSAIVVGQYYMTKINTELGKISDGISQIQDFQDNEYHSRVFSLVVQVQKIAVFQTEIVEKDELRLSKINQLDRLEEKCTQLLGQANYTLDGITNKTNLKYKDYENTVGKANKWFIYQKLLLDLLYTISDLQYTLHLGTISREQCVADLQVYTNQISDTQKRLTEWHKKTTQRLEIDTDKGRRRRRRRRRRTSIFSSIFHGRHNDSLHYSSIDNKTVAMITAQTTGHEILHMVDMSELYEEDVQLISKDGKIYYLPESQAEQLSSAYQQNV